MIDLKTGIMEFDGVRITPTITIADLRKFDAEKVTLNIIDENAAVATIRQFVNSNGINAEITIEIGEGYGIKNVTISPCMDDPKEARLLEASRQWLKGEAINGTYIENKNQILGKYEWGSIVAQYYDDRDWGTVGGEIHIRYEV